jgi:uncharacterized damage-inducible protein DinB
MQINPQLLVMLLHLEAQLRGYMMDNLTEEDLAFRVPSNPTLGELCREMGNVERFYLESFKTGKLIWDVQRDDTPETAASLEKLKAWYKALDEEFEAVLTAIPDSEFEAKEVERSGRSMPAGAHYHTYHEAVLIFCAKCSVYLRMMGKPLNEMWIDWIG